MSSLYAPLDVLELEDALKWRKKNKFSNKKKRKSNTWKKKTCKGKENDIWKTERNVDIKKVNNKYNELHHSELQIHFENFSEPLAIITCKIKAFFIFV